MKKNIKIGGIEMSYIRKCSVCGEYMVDGFVFDGGMSYYCDEKCLHTEFTEEEWIETYDDGNSDSYWTEWDGEENVTYAEMKEEVMELAWEKAPSSNIGDYHKRNMYEATLNLIMIRDYGNDSIRNNYEVEYYDAVQILNEVMQHMATISKI